MVNAMTTNRQLANAVENMARVERNLAMLHYQLAGYYVAHAAYRDLGDQHARLAIEHTKAVALWNTIGQELSE